MQLIERSILLLYIEPNIFNTMIICLNMAAGILKYYRPSSSWTNQTLPDTTKAIKPCYRGRLPQSALICHSSTPGLLLASSGLNL